MKDNNKLKPVGELEKTTDEGTQQATHLLIPIIIVEKLLLYLKGRPWEEVHEIIMGITTSQLAISNPQKTKNDSKRIDS